MRLKRYVLDAHRLLTCLLKQPWIDVFCRKLEFRKGPPTDRLLNRNAPQLVLVQWSPSKMDWAVPPVIEGIIAHFRELAEHLSIHFESICLWSPTKEKRQTFKVCLNYAGAAELFQLVIDSVNWCQQHLEDLPRRPLSCDPRTFSEADEAWRSSLNQINNQYQQGRTWAIRNEKLRSDVLMPLRQQAESSSDPIERGLTMALADLSEIMEPQMAMLRAKLEKTHAQGNVPTQGNLPQHDLEAMLKLVDRALAMTKEIHTCQSNKTFAPRKKAPPGSD